MENDKKHEISGTNRRSMNIEELKPLEINPFKGKGDEQIKQIAKSIESFEKMMTIRKIVIDENNNILGGNKRYFALKSLGYKEIPDEWIDKRTDLTADEKQEFIVKDNAHWGSEWDLEILTDWEVPLLDWGIEFEDMDLMSSIRDGVFQSYLDDESDEFSMTFVFAKEDEKTIKNVEKNIIKDNIVEFCKKYK